MKSLSLGDFKKKLSMDIEDSFFKEEVRCGFTVTEKQKKIWAVELDLVSKLLEVCKKYDLKVFVFAGTLLGAIRHKGFIPWDDDFDVVMYRDDFEKLQEIATLEFREPYFFQTGLSDRSAFIGYGRLRNSLTTGYILDYESATYHQGIYIDVYVCDGLTHDEKKLHKQLIIEKNLTKILNIYGNKIRTRNGLKKTMKRIIHNSFCRVIKYEKVVKWYRKNITRYNKECEEVSTLTHEMSIIQRMKFSKKQFEDIIEMPYENIMVPVPSDYDTMLHHMYGNYMEFPPIEQRGAWHEGIIEFDPDIPYQEFWERQHH